MGAWIETINLLFLLLSNKSHPAWVRGLKLFHFPTLTTLTLVAPCMGAWIETYKVVKSRAVDVVAPCMGAWIETYLQAYKNFEQAVAPCVGAWIETYKVVKSRAVDVVAPCVGAWIETILRAVRQGI